MNKKHNIGSVVYILALLILAFGFLALILEKSHVTNFYTKPVNTQSSSPRPVNDIDYSPASPTDNNATDQKKENGTIDQTNTVNPSEPISVTLTAAGQDTAGGPVIVRVLITNANSGTCTVTMQNENTTKTYTNNVVDSGTYYSCEPLDIPLSDISLGTWVLKVDVSDGTNTGSAQQTIEVTK